MPIALNGLDPTLASLGVAIGLLTKAGSDFTLNPGWFSDPLSGIQNMPSNPAFLPFLEQLLGAVSGGASTGAASVKNDRTWYPISVPNDQGPQPTGLYLVVEVGADAAAIAGVGVSHTFTGGVAIPFEIKPSIYLPIVKLPQPQSNQIFEFVLGENKAAIELGLDLSGQFSGGGIQFDGATILGTIALGSVPPIKPDVQIRNLKLQPSAPGFNWSLQDMIVTPDVNEWTKVVAAVLSAQLTNAVPADPAAGKILDAVLGLLGIKGSVPPINWKAVEHDSGAALAAWFRSIAQSPQIMTAWLGELYTLFNPQATTPEVSGTGSLAAPWRIALAVAGKTRLELTFAVLSDAAAMHVYPGVSFVYDPDNPISGVPVQATVEVDVRLLDLTLPRDGPATANAFPAFEASVVLNHPVAAVPTPLLTIGGTAPVRIDSVRFGFALPAGGGPPAPMIQVVNLVTEFGSWPVLDLAQFNTQAIVQALDAIVRNAIDAQLGLTSGSGSPANQLATHAAAAIGVIPSPSAPGPWPLSTTGMLLSDDQLSLVAANPLKAVGAYYTRALSVSAAPVWPYLLVDLAALLGGTGASLVNPAAKGEPDDPWQVELGSLGAGTTVPTAYLEAWQPATGVHELVFAVEIRIPVALAGAGVAGSVSLVVELLHLTLPASDGTGPVDAEWLPAVTAQLRITSAGGAPLTTPQVAGTQFQLNDALLSLGWQRGQPIGVEAVAHQVALLPGSALPVDIAFGSATTAWTAQLAQPAIAAAGSFILEHGGRFGVPLVAALGALPALPGVIDGSGAAGLSISLPAGIALPSTWPKFQLQHPTNPWLDLQQQLRALLASSASMEALLRLVGWAVTSAVPPAPATVPAGTHDDPWSVLLSNVWNAEPLVWLVDATRVGLGLQRVMTSAPGSFQFETRLRFDLAGLPLVSGGTLALTPTVALTARLQGSDAGQPFLHDPNSGLTIQTTEFGIAVSFDGTEATCAPVLTLTGARLSSTDAPRTITLTPVPGTPQFTTGIDAQRAEALLDRVASAIIGASPPALQATVEALGLLSLLQPSGNDPPGTAAGIRIDAWQALLADPGAFLTKAVQNALADPTTPGALYEAALGVLGLPSLSPTPALENLGRVLSALSLLEPMEEGLYSIALSSWMSLLSQPFAFLSKQVKTLFGDANRLRKLITKLSPVSASDPSGKYVSLDPTGTKVSLTIPESLAIGDELSLSGHLTLDTRGKTVGLQLTAAVRAETTAVAADRLGVALVLDYALDANGTPTGPTISLAGTDPLRAPFDPLQIYPIPADTGAIERALLLLVLSAVMDRVVNGFVLPSETATALTPEQPFALNVFKLLGLVTRTGTGKAAQVRPLLGIWRNPGDWLLNQAVLGNGSGGLDPQKLAAGLNQLVPAGGLLGPGSIVVQPHLTSGVALSATLNDTGKFTVTAQGDAASGLAIDIELAVGAEVDVKAGVVSGLGTSARVDGSVTLDLDLGTAALAGPTVLSLQAGYDPVAGFSLTVGGIPLFPFKGLNSLLSGTGPQALVDILGGRLFAAYNGFKAQSPSSPVVPFVNSVLSATGVTDAASLSRFVESWIANPLKPFDPINAPATVTGVLSVLQDTLKFTTGFAADPVDRGLLVFSHPLDSSGAAITVKAGTRTLPGQGSGFGLWILPTETISWLQLTATGPSPGDETGVWIDLPPTTSPAVSFGVFTGLAANLANPALPVAPSLEFSVKNVVPAQTNPTWTLQLAPAGVVPGRTNLFIDLLKAQLGWTDPAAVDTGTWLEKLAVQLLCPLLGGTLLSVKEVRDWLSTGLVSGNTATSPGSILTAWGLLLQPSAGTFALNNLNTLLAEFRDPTALITRFLGSLLQPLASASASLPFGGGQPGQAHGAISLVGTKQGQYGFGLRLQDITLTGSAGQPRVVLQLGDWMASDNDNWITRSNPRLNLPATPGLNVYLIESQGSGYQFAPRVDLVSIGLDFDGADAQHPLVDLDGFLLGAVRPRLYLSLQTDIAGAPSVEFGAGVYCDRIGLPLGPHLGSEGGNNPVAENLLSSGGGTTSGPSSSVNPQFSASVAMVSGGQFSARLYDPQNNSVKDELWINVQQSFGPLACQKVGLQFQDSDLAVDFDGSVSLAGLEIDLQGLRIAVPLGTPTDFTKYVLTLQGLGISYQGGPVAISGGFLQVGTGATTEYSGEALIEAAGFEVAGLGSYTTLPSSGAASLFVYAALDTPLGGSPFFFVLGVAAGFGYNRGLVLPGPDRVRDFPLVAWAMHPTMAPSGSLKNVLEELATDIPPQSGESWIAAGIRWTSFELLNGFALLTVAFGTDVEIALLGTVSLAIPTASLTLAYAELDLTVSFSEASGLLATTAALAPSSYVLDPACHLTGGFAFYYWFKDQPSTGAHSGDFVVTLGGYHPDFLPPSYYPSEPRLGFNWHLSDALKIQGGLYFALTPSAVMAGGELSATFQAGPLKAWFDAYANFLIEWRPFHFDITVGIDVGASLRVDVLFVHQTFTVELGASIHVWGPPIAGSVHVSWWVISFTIDFGESTNTPAPPLSWDEFGNAFLNLPAAPAAAGVMRAAVSRSISSNGDDSQLVKVRLSGGLIRTVPQLSGADLWVINPHQLALVVDTTIPASAIELNTLPVGYRITAVSTDRMTVTISGTSDLSSVFPAGATFQIAGSASNNGTQQVASVAYVPQAGAQPAQFRINVTGGGLPSATADGVLFPAPSLGVRPMRMPKLDSALTVTVTKTDGDIDDVADLAAELVLKSVPVALWSTALPPLGGFDPAQVIPNVMGGLQITPAPAEPLRIVGPVSRALIIDDAPQRDFAWGNLQPPQSLAYSTGQAGIEQLMNSVMSSTAASARQQVLAALVANGVLVDPSIDLSVLAATANQVFQSVPILVQTGAFPTPLPATPPA